MTTIGCFAYTWGYYEGIHNTKTTQLLDRVHDNQLHDMAHSNGHRHNDTHSGKKGFHTGHGLHSIKETSLPQVVPHPSKAASVQSHVQTPVDTVQRSKARRAQNYAPQKHAERSDMHRSKHAVRTSSISSGGSGSGINSRSRAARRTQAGV
eukprot:CAMPEP_0202901218 /NCGR_PEP_ID=MMETSP1392-20130828/14014_1 /ASSEMBLY_ACC=CAM_ASM_000868 /TAXON_ID=225041 /ORGANISM="Chlamydomonas chlamydogama, Strain SAG 11-48b" /LENGTH=150 /DNA_ID=CAMNT_0049587747 /DNA_START=197 /DNA_END=649 /DNA_ORIENTATION=-